MANVNPALIPIALENCEPAPFERYAQTAISAGTRITSEVVRVAAAHPVPLPALTAVEERVTMRGERERRRARQSTDLGPGDNFRGS